jgi:hypothetical protein
VLDDFLRPLVRGYYSSPQLTLLLTFLHANWKGIIHSPWVYPAPYLSSFSSISHDSKKLKLVQWFEGSTSKGPDAEVFRDYGTIILDFLEDPNRSAELALNEERFAAAALCCLEYLCSYQPHIVHIPHSPSSHGSRIRRNTPWKWRKISIPDANLTKRETFHLHHIVPKFPEVVPYVEPYHAEVISRSLFYRRGLEHLPFLLERSGHSQKLIRFLRRRVLFAVGALEHHGVMNRARSAIAKYLSTSL